MLIISFSTVILADENIEYQNGVILNDSADIVDQIVYNPSVQISEDNLVEYRKSIKQIDNDRFNIRFDILAQNKIETVKGLPASVVLVLDTSGSMLNIAPDGNTIFFHAKLAVEKFAREFLGNGEGNRLLGLIAYDQDAFNAMIDVNGKGQPLTSDLDYFLNMLNLVQPANYSTNIQIGLYKARNVLNNYGGNNPKHIVLFSDGAANLSYKAGVAKPIDDTPITPHIASNGTVMDMNFKLSNFNYDITAFPFYNLNGFHINNHYIPTISEGIIAREQDNINIYTVFFRNNNLSDIEYDSGVFTMLNIATKGQYHEIHNIIDLADLFNQLEYDIIHKTRLWIINDPFPDYMTFDGFVEEQPGAVYNSADRTLSWNLMNMEITPEFENGKYKYSLSYDVSFLSNNIGIENNTAYSTNNNTILEYFVGEHINTGTKKQVEFEVPLIRTSSMLKKYLTVYPLDMIAYQGGQSASGNSFPRPYFLVKDESGHVLTDEELKEFTFYMDGEVHVPGDHEYFIYELPFRAVYVNKETNVTHYDPSEEYSSEDVGVYNIQLTTKDNSGKVYYVTAVRGNEVYDFRFYQNASLEIRAQNQETHTSFAPILEGKPGNYKPSTPVAFVPKDTQFKNSAGINLNPLSTSTNVALMSDTLLPENQQGIENAISQLSAMQGLAHETVYLNLVDHADGNIIVQADKPVTVLYPYPTGTNKNTSFTVLHFREVNRGVDFTPKFEPDFLIAVNLEHGIAFDVSSFSPFAIAYQNKIYTVQFNLNGGTGPLSQYSSQSIPMGGKVVKPANPVRSGFVFMGWEVNVSGSMRLWNFNDSVNNDMVLIAKWKPQSDVNFTPELTPNPESTTTPSSTTTPTTTPAHTTPPANSDKPEQNVEGEHLPYVVGYPDKSFRAERYITRAEAASIFARLIEEKMELPFYASTFVDVKPGLWYSNYIGFMQQRGIIKGDNNYFRPNEPITRAEFAVLASAFSGLTGDATLSFSDVPNTHWAFREISLAVKRGWLKAYNDGTFRPENYITRGDVVTLSNQVLGRNPDIAFIKKSYRNLIDFIDLPKDFKAYYEIIEAANKHRYLKTGQNMEIWLD